MTPGSALAAITRSCLPQLGHRLKINSEYPLDGAYSFKHGKARFHRAGGYAQRNLRPC
jgi:hypothetical protein